MTIKNLDRLLQKLDSLGGNSQKALKTGIHQATKLVQGDAKALCPVGDSGHLRNSIQVETEERDGNIVGCIPPLFALNCLSKKEKKSMAWP